MYTQCPDCSTAFRVSAEVLKQAAGKVRCGGCGNAFNALDYLSEQKPAPTVGKEPEPSLPELTPEAPGKEDKLPQSISAEQSAALLKTLDELAGSDIRIEDTGVEWRVFDEEDDDVEDIGAVVDTRGTDIDEVLEDSPTPVDQFLTATPNDVEAAEIFEESANEPGRTPVDELRFDDNTPLPDDFDLDDESSYMPESPAVEEPAAEETVVENVQPPSDLDLSEPDEWEGILDEFEDLREGATPAPLEAELDALDAAPEEQPPVTDEPAAESDAPSADQELLDMDTQFALQAEAMGIDLSGMHKEIEELEEETSADDAKQDLEAAPEEEPEEAQVSQNDEEPGQEDFEEAAAELVVESPDEVGDASVVAAEEDSAQLELIEEEEEEEAPLEFGAVAKELADLEDQSDVFDSSFFKAADEAAAEIEEEAPDVDAEPEPEEEVDLEKEIDLEDAIDLEKEIDLEEAIDLEKEIDLEEDIDLAAEPDLKEELELGAEPYPEDELELEPRADDNGSAGEDGPDDEHVVPPMTEEEQTINMMIDQDLLSLAIEDDEGFASTISIPGKDAGKQDKKRKKDKKGKKGKKKNKQTGADEKDFFAESGQGFETIIMEGEHVRSAHEEIKLEAHAVEAAELVAASKAEEAAMVAASRGKRIRMVSGIVALVLVLSLQVLHQSREALATIPLFNSVVGPVYRAIGKPLSPAWDITGWRIEATKGSIEEDDEKLVVYSRIGNKSDSPLPYPIINISLTDRFEETLGSRQLDPAEYLPDNLDPRELVQPGNNFNAVISIQSPSADASGYELDVCYRVSDGQLRCAMADFK